MRAMMKQDRPRLMTTVDGDIAARVRRYREWACLSRAQAARELGITSQTLRRYESGDSQISGATLFAMSLLYDVTVSELFPSPPLHHSSTFGGLQMLRPNN